jgi:hypothetical protein
MKDIQLTTILLLILFRFFYRKPHTHTPVTTPSGIGSGTASSGMSTDGCERATVPVKSKNKQNEKKWFPNREENQNQLQIRNRLKFSKLVISSWEKSKGSLLGQPKYLHSFQKIYASLTCCLKIIDVQDAPLRVQAHKPKGNKFCVRFFQSAD